MAKEDIVARVSMENGKLVFETFSDDEIKDKLYPHGNGRIGAVILDTEKHLGITKEALPKLKELFEKSPSSGDGLGDIDWFKSNDGKLNFGWLGGNKRVFESGDEVYKAKGASFVEDKFVLLD